MIGWMGMTTRHIETQQIAVKGESDALNFLNYRDAVVRYLNANAMANGTVADGVPMEYRVHSKRPLDKCDRKF